MRLLRSLHRKNHAFSSGPMVNATRPGNGSALSQPNQFVICYNWIGSDANLNMARRKTVQFSLEAQSVLHGWLFPLHNNIMVLALGAIRMDIGYTLHGIVNKFPKHTADLTGQVPSSPAGLAGRPKPLQMTDEQPCYSG